MWSDFVVMCSPAIDDISCFSQTSEPMLVKAAVAELTVKAFYKGILSWFPRLVTITEVIGENDRDVRAVVLLALCVK